MARSVFFCGFNINAESVSGFNFNSNSAAESPHLILSLLS